MTETKRVSYRFTRSQRLLRTTDYQDVFKKQTKIMGEYWLIFFNDDTYSTRLGLAISKKVSTLANQRNRLKRICREQFRLNQHHLPLLDIVIVAKKHSVQQPNVALIKDLNQLFQKL